ncbi:MAG: O-antigen ligase family protein [Elusimicrobia bacterium]|nr:O-antigen ligase family protein [Elusimicrobiota bacterium]
MTDKDKCVPTIQESYPQVFSFLLLGFFGYVLIWFLQVGHRVEALGVLRVEFIVAAVLASLAVLLRPRMPEEAGKRRKSSLTYYIAAFFVCIVVQLPYSHAPDVSLQVFIDRVVKFAFMAYFMTQFVRSPRGMRFFLAAFLSACFYITQESFRAGLTGSMVWQNQGVPRLHGDTPLFAHPNSLGGLAMGVLPFVYFLFPVVKSNLLRMMLAAMTVTSMGCVLFSASRTAYLALFVLGGFLWLSSRRKALFLLMSMFLAAAAWPSMPEHYQVRLRTIFTGEEVEGSSMQKRKEILRDAAAVFHEHPFGVGVSAFPAVRQQVFGRVQDTHNLYLEVATNLGAQGLVVFGLLLMKLMATFRVSRVSIEAQMRRVESRLGELRKTPGASFEPLRTHLNDLRMLRAACMAGMGYIIIRLALGFFGHDLYEIYWWIGTGMALSLHNIDQFSRKITDRLTETIHVS